MANIAVFAEIEDGVIHDISLQCIAKARALAGAGGKVIALAAGHGVSAPAAKMFGYGADEVFAADDAALNGYIPRRYRKVVASWLVSQSPALALFPSTTLGLDLAASVAGELKAPCALYCDDIQAADGGWRMKRIEFDRKVATQFAPAAAGTAIATLRDGAADAPVFDAARTGTVQPAQAGAVETVARVLKREVAKKTVNLKDAKIIVAGGAGVGSAENFQLLRDFAAKLGAEIGATRAVVDAGWLPADHQIGQTGATVKPAVYIACGISGAVQHRVGMMDSGKIVAINTDPNAPIFKIAHYQIVGDLKVVLPKLMKCLPG